MSNGTVAFKNQYTNTTKAQLFHFSQDCHSEVLVVASPLRTMKSYINPCFAIEFVIFSLKTCTGKTDSFS